MKILFTGATGYIGSRIAVKLAAEGHHVLALVRNVAKAQQMLPKVRLIEWPSIETPIEIDHYEFDCVVNLMGENIAGERWSEARKQALYDSRIKGTKKLLELLEEVKVKTFIQASAIGIYGDSGIKEMTEESPAGAGFLANICRDWEKVISENAFLFQRTAMIRIGVVLGKGSGAMEKMLPVFKSGFAGKLGDGRQYMSWIHIDDLVEIFIQAIKDSNYSGAINATAPKPVTNEQFTKVLGGILKRPTFFAAPAFVLKLVMGEMSQMILGGSKVIPKKLKKLGYEFKFSKLDSALEDVVK